jgi:hypothetical protein
MLIGIPLDASRELRPSLDQILMLDTPLAQRIALAEAEVRDLDGRIAKLDAMVNAATGRGGTKTAMALVGRQSASRAALVRCRASATRGRTPALID